MKKPLLRLAIMFGWIPLAFLIGSLAHSEHVFIVVMGIGLVVSILLGRTLLR
jgi:hypothetical protein